MGNMGNNTGSNGIDFLTRCTSFLHLGGAKDNTI